MSRRLLVSLGVVVGLLIPTTSATALSSDRSWDRLAADHDAGRVVVAVKVHRGATGALAAVAGAARVAGGEQRRVLGKLDTVTVKVPKGGAKAFAVKMRGRQDVAKVELVPRRELSFIPDDEKYPATAPYLTAVTAPAAWDIQRGDPSLRIAVVDSGVDITHPDLTGRVVETFNAVDGGSDVTDTVGHGTFVAGVAAATAENGIGIAGASMGASVMAVKVSDAQDEIWADALAAGIIWAADHGAKVINLSLGGTTTSQLERDAVAYATSRGVLLVAAAGNGASSTPSYPAAYPQVVAVGATDGAGHAASFSNFGPWVTVAAPGVNITGTTPSGGGSEFPSATSGYGVASGTSFSSPIVAAQAALLWSRGPAALASEIRQAIVSSAHGYADLGLGAGQVDFRAAYDALRPDSVPTLTQPVDGATVRGVVQLSATSSAARVRFLIGGVPIGTPVATVAGTARTSWASWGMANGPRIVTAVDCTLASVCTSLSSRVDVELANNAPAVTSPAASQTLSGSATFTATGPGGGVAFMIDGVRRGFDATAPYALTYAVSSLTDAAHTVAAVSCSVTGTACAGPTSPPVPFTARSLHPRITAVAPSLFSPNPDGRNDNTRATYYLPDTESVRFLVRNAAGTIVRGPTSLGTLTRGTRTITWNGMYNNGARAASGAYILEIATTPATGTSTLRGSAVAGVRVDNSAPTMASITGTGNTFYPYPDAYRDTFAARFTLNEPATVNLVVRTGTGALVRSLTWSRVPGATTLLWSGTNALGSRVGAGTYYWTMTAQDPAGNRRVSPRYSLVVNAKRLVTKTTTVSLRGRQYSSAGGSASCAWASALASDFYPNGVWLANNCDYSQDGSQVAGSTYRFALPSAFGYTSLRAVTSGHSLGPSRVGVAFTRWASGDDLLTPGITVGTTNAWRTFATVAATGLVSSTRQVEATLYAPNDVYSPSDYDVNYLNVVVTYRVLV